METFTELLGLTPQSPPLTEAQAQVFLARIGTAPEVLHYYWVCVGDNHAKVLNYRRVIDEETAMIPQTNNEEHLMSALNSSIQGKEQCIQEWAVRVSRMASAYAEIHLEWRAKADPSDEEIREILLAAVVKYGY